MTPLSLVGVLLILNIILTIRRGLENKQIMTDLSKLTADVEAIAAIIPAIKTDYESLKAALVALQGQIDPQEQAKIDSLTASLDASFAALKAIDTEANPPAPAPVAPVEPAQ